MTWRRSKALTGDVAGSAAPSPVMRQSLAVRPFSGSGAELEPLVRCVRDEAVLLLLLTVLLTAFAAAAHCKRRPQRIAWFSIL